MKKIILVTGKKRHGKDYVSLLLKEQLEKNNRSAFIFAFADAPKNILCTSLNITRDQFDEYKNNDDSLYDSQGNILVSFRELIQRFGTDAMQSEFGKTVWSKKAKEIAENRSEEFVIISDFRFKHELISETTIKVFNNDITSNDTHISENALNDCSFKFNIDNTGKPDLSQDIEKIVSLLLNK